MLLQRAWLHGRAAGRWHSHPSPLHPPLSPGALYRTHPPATTSVHVQLRSWTAVAGYTLTSLLVSSRQAFGQIHNRPQRYWPQDQVQRRAQTLPTILFGPLRPEGQPRER